jgi:8-oxo-dGTP diphosphatase
MIDEPIIFCPRCGTSLIELQHSGRLRPTCPNCHWVYFPDPKVAVVTLITQASQVLLVQRRYDPQQGRWTLPGGFVDAAEDPRLAAARECLEETGLSIQNLQLLDVMYSSEHPRGASILIVYRAQVAPGNITPGDDAVQAVFFDIHHLPPLAFASTQQICKLYLY